MPIVGLTGRETGYPRLGKIKKGAEKPDRGPGKELDHFRFDFAKGREWMQSKAQEFYGPEPRELRVWLPYSSVEENFNPYMKEYGSGSLKRMCDGQKQVLWLPESSGTYKGEIYGDKPIPCIQGDTNKPCRCKQDGALKVVLKEFLEAGIVGYFEITTHSKWDISHIDGALRSAYALGGDLIGIPFVVERIPETQSIPMGDKRSQKEFNFIKIQVDPTWLDQQFTAKYLKSVNAALPMLPGDGSSDVVDGEFEDDEPQEIDKLTFLKTTAEQLGVTWDDAKKAIAASGLKGVKPSDMDGDQMDKAVKALQDLAKTQAAPAEPVNF